MQLDIPEMSTPLGQTLPKPKPAGIQSPSNSKHKLLTMKSLDHS